MSALNKIRPVIGFMTGKPSLRSSQRVRHVEHNALLCVLTLRSIQVNAKDQRSFFQMLGKQMSLMGVPSSCVVLLDEPIHTEKGQPSILGKEVHLYMVQNQDKVRVYHLEKDAIRLGKRKLNAYTQGKKKNCLMDFVLFYRDIQYGVLSVEMPPEEAYFCHTLSLELGTPSLQRLRFW